MRTMASEFARQGNPMLTEREREEMQARLIPARGGRKMAKPKPVYRDPKPQPSPRVLSDSQAALKEMLRHIDAPARRYLPDPKAPPRVEISPALMCPTEMVIHQARVEIARAEQARSQFRDGIAHAEAEKSAIWDRFGIAMAFYIDDSF